MVSSRIIFFSSALYCIPLYTAEYNQKVSKKITELETIIEKAVQQDIKKLAQAIANQIGCTSKDIEFSDSPKLSNLIKLRGIITEDFIGFIDIKIKSDHYSQGKIIGTFTYKPTFSYSDATGKLRVSQFMDLADEIDVYSAPPKIQRQLGLLLLKFFTTSIAPRFYSESIQSEAQRLLMQLKSK